MRAVRSFDPCLPCGVHMYLGDGKVLKKLHTPTHAQPVTAEGAGDDRSGRDLPRGRRRASRSCSPSSRRRPAAPRERAEELVRLVARVLRRRPGATCRDRRAAAPDGSGPAGRRRAGRQPARPARPASRGRPRPGSSRRSTGPALPGLARRRCRAARRRRRGVVRLRLEGTCDGCPSSTVTRQAGDRAAPSRRPRRRSPLEVENLTGERSRTAPTSPAPRRGGTASRARAGPPDRVEVAGRRGRGSVGGDCTPTGPLPGLRTGLRPAARRRLLAARRAARFDVRLAGRGSTSRLHLARCPCWPDGSAWPRRRAGGVVTESGAATFAPAATATRRPCPSRRPGSAARCAPSRSATSHGHVVEPRAAARSCAPAGPATCCSPTRRRGRRPLPRRARPLPARPGVRARRGRWDALQIPVRRRLLLPQLRRSTGWWRFYPSPAGATESLLPLDAWDEVVAANPAWPTSSPTSRRCWCGAAGEGFECFLVPIDACYELVGLVRLHWKGFDGGEEAWRGDRRLLRRRSAPRAAPADREATPWPTSSSTASAPAPSATRPSRRWCFRLRIAETAGARRCTPSRCAARSGSSRSGAATTAPRRPRLLRPVRRAAPLGRHAKPLQFATRLADGARLHRQHRGRPAGALHLRLRGRRGQVLARARRRRDPAAAAVQRHRVHQGGAGFSVEPGAVAQGGDATGCRSRSGAR